MALLLAQGREFETGKCVFLGQLQNQKPRTLKMRKKTLSHFFAFSVKRLNLSLFSPFLDLCIRWAIQTSPNLPLLLCHMKLFHLVWQKYICWKLPSDKSFHHSMFQDSTTQPHVPSPCSRSCYHSVDQRGTFHGSS